MKKRNTGRLQAMPVDCLAGGGEMGARMRAYDWSATPLGAVATWPQSLKTAVRIMLTSRQPIWLGWGAQLIKLYNDPYQAIVGGKHPGALGQPAAVVWREIWPEIGPMLETALGGVEGTYVEAQLLIMERNGYPEETYYTFSYSPIPNDQGGVGGIICANTDDTGRVIGERQLTLLRELAARTADARTVAEACALSLAGLATNPHDLPFALIYLVEPEAQRVTLAGQCGGLERGHAVAPVTARLDDAAIWPFAEVLATNRAGLVTDLSQFADSLPVGAWDRPPHQAVVVPIAPQGRTGQAGLLVVGLNPYRLFDDKYRGFLELVAAQIGIGIARAQAYEEERRRTEALAELDRAKTEFFSNVSHEFRTPLTLMLGPLEDLLAQSNGQHNHRAQLEVVHRNSLRLLKLVNTLLDFSRLEAGRIQAAYEPVDLAAYTAELASVFRAAIEKAGLQLIVDCPPLEKPVYVDREMWEKIVLNLLSNALKFTFTGRITVSLKLVVPPLGGSSVAPREPAKAGITNYVELRVRDTGTGIPKAELPHLFTRFHQVRGARSRSHEGSGIGLALVQELVTLHGGTVRVESRVNRGTTFIVTIPTGTAHLPADRIGAARTLSSTGVRGEAYVAEAARWLPADDAATRRRGDAVIPEHDSLRLPEEDGEAALSSPRPRVPASPRQRILLADDNADMREYVRRLLSQDYEVVAVADGQAALQAAREQSFDLVLTDVMMPQLDGFGLLKELRADERTRTLPIILLSARAGEESRVEGMEAGADDYLVKPFSAKELLARVASRLEITRLRREADKSLRESEERFRLLTENAKDYAIIFLDTAARITHWNPGAERILGYAEEEVVGQPGHIIFTPEDRANGVPEKELTTAQAQGHARDERWHLRKDGSRFFASGEMIALYDEANKLRGFAKLFRDLTERRSAEENLRQSEERFRAYVTASSDVVYRMSADWTEMRHLEGREFIADTLEPSRTWIDKYIHPDDRARVTATIDEAIRTKSIFELEHRVIRVDGTLGWTFSRAVPMLDEQGRIVEWFGAAADVTERKRAEEARRVSEEKYRTVFSSIDEGFCIVEVLLDDEGRPRDYLFLEINPAFAQLTGLANAVGKTALELIPGLESFWVETYGRVALTGEAVRFENYAAPMNRWFNVHASRVGGEGSRRVAIVFTNITERKRAAEVERRAAARDAFRVALADALRPLADPIEIQATASRVLGEHLGASRVAYFEVRGAAYFVARDYTNDAVPLAGSYPVASFGPALLATYRSGRVATASDVAGDDQLAPSERAAYAAIQIGAYIGVPLIKNGEFVAGLAVQARSPRAWTADEIALAEETAERTWAAVERARAEAALRESEARFRLMADAVPQIVWITDADGRMQFFNRQFTDYTGEPYEPRMPAEIAARYIHPDDGPAVVAGFEQAQAAGGMFAVEHRIKSRDGDYRWFLVKAEPYRDPASGEIVKWFGASVDIHDRKLAEAALRESEERYRFATRATHDTVWDWDMLKDEVVWSEALHTVFGYPPEQAGVVIRDAFAWWTAHLHPDDRARVGGSFERAADRGSEEWYEEYRFLRADGTYAEVVDAAFIVYDAVGKPIRITGAMSDVTERKQAAEALLASEEKYRTLFDSIDEGYCVIEMIFDEHRKAVDYLFEQINPVFSRLSGLPEDTVGKTMREMIPNHEDYWFEIYGRVARTGESIRLENYAAGLGRWFDVYALRIGGDGSRRVGVVFNDITARKRRELTQQFLLDLDKRLGALSEPEEIEQATINLLGQFLRVSHCYFAHIYNNERGVIEHEFRAPAVSVSLIAEHRVTAFNPPERIAQFLRGETVVNHDVVMDAGTAALADNFALLQIRAFASTPIFFSGEWVGILNVTSHTPRVWLEDELELLREVAARVWPLMERARAVAAVRASEERYRGIVNQTIGGIAETDLTGRFTTVNDRYCQITGYTREELMNLRLQEITHPEDLRGNLALFEKLLTAGTPFEIEKRYVRPDGSAIWVHNSVSAIRDAAGAPQSVIAVSIDITARKQIEETLRENDRRKDEFLAMLAHELRNPLAPITNAVHVLKLLDPAQPQLQWAQEIIERQTQHLTRLVDDLLDVSRITRGKVTLQRQTLDVKTIINRAVETGRPLVDAHRHQLTITTPAEPLRVEGDLTRLVQIVGNLLNNAAKYTDDGGRIQLEVARENAQVIIRVRDNGIGLPAELLPQVFDLFTQAKRSLDRSQGGLGIGLTLVRSLVELHGGTVEAHSAGLGQGSEFTVRLPEFKPAPVANNAATDGASARAAAAPKLKVLIVEDNVDAAESMAFLLRYKGHEVRLAHDGLAALAAAQELQPQAVLLDIGLPELDGYEVARRLRAQPDFQRTLLVALTGYGQEEDRRLAQDAGFDHHLTKPVEPTALNALLQKL